MTKDEAWLFAQNQWEIVAPHDLRPGDCRFGPSDSPVWWIWGSLQRYVHWTAAYHLLSIGIRLN